MKVKVFTKCILFVIVLSGIQVGVTHSVNAFPHAFHSSLADSDFQTSERYPVQHASLPHGLKVQPLPQEGADHLLKFNISWLPPFTGRQPKDYSIEVHSVTNTSDCQTLMCYECCIPGTSQWRIVPPYLNSATEVCAIHPGCAYRIKMTAHPWDGHTAANLHVELKECEAGVCSCAHAPRLPAPEVSAHVLSRKGKIYANISWTLPRPRHPHRLPPNLNKQFYYVSIGKQMVSDAHPAPWFTQDVFRNISADGPVSVGDNVRSILVPIPGQSDGHSGQRSKDVAVKRDIILDVKLLARVSLVDERDCVGPAGNATAYDPAEANKTGLETYVLWAVFGGLFMLAMVGILAVSAQAVKRVLNALRPAPLEPLRRRRAWLPLQQRTSKRQWNNVM